MDKLLTTEMQATLRALQLVGSVIECDADGCHGDARGELLLLIRNLRSGEAKFQFEGSERVADQAQAALDVHDTRQRIGGHGHAAYRPVETGDGFPGRVRPKSGGACAGSG